VRDNLRNRASNPLGWGVFDKIVPPSRTDNPTAIPSNSPAEPWPDFEFRSGI